MSNAAAIEYSPDQEFYVSSVVAYDSTYPQEGQRYVVTGMHISGVTRTVSKSNPCARCGVPSTQAVTATALDGNADRKPAAMFV